MSYQSILRTITTSSSRNLTKTVDSKSTDSKYVQPAKGLWKAITNYLSKFIGSYEGLLAKRFPKAFKLYQVFTIGTRDLYKDIVEYMRISRELSYGRDARDLTYRELLIYYQTPKDLLKVGPTLLVSAAPFANYIVFPLAAMFPKQFLSSQFWTLEQRFNNQLETQTRRLKHNRPVFRQLQFKLPLVPSHLDDYLDYKVNFKDQCKQIFDKIGSGTHPTVDEILSVAPVFSEKPYGLLHLNNNHLRHLCKLHGLPSYPRKIPRLVNYGGLIVELDLAILRLGGPSYLSDEEIRQASYMRGLNPYGCRRDELIDWLSRWLYISEKLNGSSLSLLLHCPVFLGYNQPSNWKLVYK